MVQVIVFAQLRLGTYGLLRKNLSRICIVARPPPLPWLVEPLRTQELRRSPKYIPDGFSHTQDANRRRVAQRPLLRVCEELTGCQWDLWQRVQVCGV